VEGVVLLDTVIGTDGSVVEVHSVSGPNDLASAAVDAVKWWRFEPYRINGQPVAVETTLAVDFKQN
jgi:TonB family protein